MRSFDFAAFLASVAVLVSSSFAGRGANGTLVVGETRFEFESWVILHGKEYATKEEKQRRKEIFKENVAKINAHNARNDVTYEMGLNEFTDMTPMEFKRLVSRPYSPRKLEAVESFIDPATSLAPASVDWTAQGAVTPVKNQGSCGSCWSFSTTGSLEGAYFLATGSLRSLSEQQLVDCSTANNGCGGGSFQNAFEYILNNSGIDSETDYSYQAYQMPCWTNATRRRVAALSSYKNVPTNDEEQLQLAVALGPVSVAIEADQSIFQSYKSGIISNASCGTKLDHGVLVTGYTSEYWIVKNSWGASWGEKGYVKIARGSSPSGICGINIDPSYPVVPKGAPLPVPPPTPGQHGLKCNCTMSCEKTCNQFGMVCCGNGIDCQCSPQSACPKCK